MRLSVDIKQKLGAFDLDVAFDTPDGITVLFGRSGSGKTSIVRSVAGLLKPASGRISAGSKVLFDAETDTFVPPHKRRIGYVFQEDRLFPHLNVAQNLEYGTRFHNSKTADKTRNEIVAMLGLEALLSRRPAGLSGGEKQRVAIGRALMSDPMLLLADEPLAALDDARKDEILPYFERLRDHLKVPMLYVTHSAAEVSRLATTVVALDKGRVIKQGPAVSILSDPQITPLGAGAAGAFLRAVVKRHFDDGITEVDAMGTSLLVPGITNPVGTQLRIRVEAQDVMIALEHPKDISALNVLPAIISEVRQGDGPGALVQLKLGENVLLARITRRSADALALKDGKPVYAIIKAVSIPRDAIGEGHDPTEN